MHRPLALTLVLTLAGAAATDAVAGSPRAAILDDLARQASSAAPSFDGFSATRGQALFATRHGGGKPKTPACSTCHGAAPEDAGKTRAGKRIEPMAVSRSPARYTDAKKVAKWFRRNCKSVLGRVCSPIEKGDFITFMINQ